MRFLPVNLSAFMVELECLEQTMALADSLTEMPIYRIDENNTSSKDYFNSLQPVQY